jgi:ATP-dependent helicase/nuclease subunit A
MSRPLVDQGARLAAASVFDRNVVVVAGAGTGKTALLTARLCVYLLGESYRRRGSAALSPARRAEEVLALTFTEKAAGEMATRLVDYLRLLAQAGGDSSGDARVDSLVLEPLRGAYGLGMDAVRARARAALEHVGRVDISTIHSFCRQLLRAHPLEVGLKPDFEVDADGRGAARELDPLWEACLSEGLGRAEPDPDWRAVVESGLDLDRVRALAWALVNAPAPLAEVLDPRALVGDPDAFRLPLLALKDQLAADCALVLDLVPARLKLCKLAALLERCLEPALAPGGWRGSLDPEDALALKGFAAKGASPLLVAQAIKPLGERSEGVAATLAQALPLLARHLAFTPAPLAALHRALTPFVARARATLKEAGAVSYDQLLLGASELLTGNPGVAARLRERYGLILLDEVQDTDPLQYSILRPLREAPGQPPWGPSGTFLVGDPKQSIYLFRSADMQAFQRVVGELGSHGAALLDICTSFRSRGGVIATVNAVFRRLFASGGLPAELQPAYGDIAVGRDDRPGGDPAVEVLHYPVDPGEGHDEVLVEDLSEAEGQVVAAHLAGLHAAGRPWGDLVVLVPARTGLDALTAHLQRAGIPHVLAGGARLFQRQEVLDTVHALACVVTPSDWSSLVAFLASPAAGVSNDALAGLALARRRLPARDSWLAAARSPDPAAHPLLCRVPAAERQHLGHLLSVLARLHGVVHQVEAWRALAEVRSSLPLVEAWSAHPEAAQRMANVEKVLDALEAEVSAGTPLARAVRSMANRSLLSGEADESGAACADLGAVRIETIHGSKGLEYPVVVVANLFRRPRARRTAEVEVARDWGTGRLAVRAGALANQHLVDYQESMAAKENAERTRVLYVALTRARDRLVLSLPSGAPADSHGGVLLEALRQARGAGELPPDLSWPEPWVPAPEAMPALDDGPAQGDADLEAAARAALDRLQLRRRALAEVAAAPTRRRPTEPDDEPFPRRDLPELEEAPEPAPPQAPARDYALRLGDLCHACLQHLDLAQAEADLPGLLASPLAARLAGELAPRILDEARDVLTPAVTAPFFRRVIASADQALREVPVLSSLDGATLSARIDLVVRHGDRWTVIDYKTDSSVAPEDELRRKYGPQRDTYTKAVQQALGLPEPPGFYLYFLRFSREMRL